MLTSATMPVNGAKAKAEEADISKERLSVVVTRRLPGEVETRLSELFDMTLYSSDTGMSRNEIVGAMKTTDVLEPTIAGTVDAAMIGQAEGRLRLTSNFGAAGGNNDVTTARKRGVLEMNAPGRTRRA